MDLNSESELERNSESDTESDSDSEDSFLYIFREQLYRDSAAVLSVRI